MTLVTMSWTSEIETTSLVFKYVKNLIEPFNSINK